MPHHPKPFYRPARKLWYVQINGRQHNLGPDEAAAFENYHALMARPEPVASELVAGILDGFLDWCQRHRKPRTYEGHLAHLQRFATSLPSPKTMTVAELRPHHLQAWVDSHPDWGPTSRRNAIASVQRAFSWAAKLGPIDRSPVAGVAKPQAARRESAASPEQYAALLSACDRPEHRDLLSLLWETGMRPQEARHVEARHFAAAGARFAIPPEEAKGDKRWRVILLTESAAATVVRLAARNPRGKLLLNTAGRPWTRYAVACLFKRLSKRSGVGSSSYLLRHGFCQRSLEAGVDHLTVAALMGHADGGMVVKVYSHMAKADAHLRAALGKANA